MATENTAAAKTEETVDVTADQLRQALAQKRVEQEQACLAEIAAVLEKHGCTLIGIPAIEAGRIVANVQVMARQ